VAHDVAEGYATREAARERFGVRLGPEGEVDAEATARLRARKHAEVPSVSVRASEAEAYRGVLGRHRVVCLGREAARALALDEGDLVELWGAHPGPLRAWVEVRADGDATLPLDEFARRVLGVREGERVVLRKLGPGS
jgi:hypothetical protein